MALSVLTLNIHRSKYGLYDSSTKSVIMTGTQQEMYDWKDTFEKSEQRAANKEYRDRIRKDRIELLVASGNTEEEANQFLKQKMPYLFKDEN